MTKRVYLNKKYKESVNNKHSESVQAIYANYQLPKNAIKNLCTEDKGQLEGSFNW